MSIYSGKWGQETLTQTICQQMGTKSLNKQLALAGFLCRTVVMQRAPERIQETALIPAGKSLLHRKYKPPQTRTTAKTLSRVTAEC